MSHCFKITTFLRSRFRSTTQLRGRSRDFPRTQPPRYQRPRDGMFVTPEPTPHAGGLPYRSLALGVGQSVGSDGCVTKCVRHGGVTQSTSTALEILCVSSAHTCPTGWPPLILYCLLGFALSRCHAVGIVRPVAFPGRLLSLSDTCPRFLCISLGLDGSLSFLFFSSFLSFIEL